MKKLLKKEFNFIMMCIVIVVSSAGCAAAKTDSNITSAAAETESTQITSTPEVTEAVQTEDNAQPLETVQPDADVYPLTVTDQIGREVVIEKPAERIVSAYYISTALCIGLGNKDKLVGIEKKADTRKLYTMAAPNLLELPAVGTAKEINVEETAALNPDIVILPKSLSDSAASFETLGIPVVVVNPETQEDFENCISLLSWITGTQGKADKLLNYIHDTMSEMATLTENLMDKPSVYLSAGSDYYSTCTSKMYQNELIAKAGGTNVSAGLQDGYWQAVSAEQLISWNPDYIFAVNYAEYSLDDLRYDAAIGTIAAVKENNIYTFPSKIEAWDYPTPSSVLGIRWLTSKLHPDLYSEEQFLKDAVSFYLDIFDITVTKEDLGL